MRVNFLDGLAVAACQRSGSAGIGVGRCSVLRRAPARRLAYLHADDAGDADVNAGPGFLGALCGGRRHFIGERRNRKNRKTSRADRDFGQNLIVIRRRALDRARTTPNAGCSSLEKCRMLTVPNETLRLRNLQKGNFPARVQIRLLRSCGTFPMESALLMRENRLSAAQNNQTAPGSDAQILLLASAILMMPDYFFAQTPDPA